MQSLKQIFVATILALSSFSAVAQTAEKLAEQASKMGNEATTTTSMGTPKGSFFTNEIKDLAKFKQAESLFEESLRLYENASKQGDSQAEKDLLSAKLKLAEMYESGGVCIKAKSLYTELSEQNTNLEVKARALYDLGMSSSLGTCSRQDESKALELYGQACDIGYNNACFFFNNR